MIFRRLKDNKKLHILLKILFLSVLIFSLFGFTDADEYEQVGGEVEDILGDFYDALPEGMDELGDISNTADRIGFKFLIENLIKTVRDGSGEFFSFFLLIFGSAILLALASQLDGELGSVAKTSVAMIASAVILAKITPIVTQIASSIDEINTFFSALIPICVSVNLLGLSPSAAAAQSMGMGISLSVYSAVGGELLMPLVGVMLAFAALSTLGDGGISRISSSVKKCFFWILGIMTVLIGALFSLQSLIGSSADSAVMRSAKYALSGMIPIVGSTVSGALSTLAGGVAYAKGIVGGGAIAVIVSLAIAPLVTLLVYRLCFTVSGLLLGLCSAGAEDFLSPIASAFDALIAVYSLTAVIYIVEFSVFLSGGAAIA